MNNEMRNSLTEHQRNHKLISPYILDCYTGLYPASMTKISLVIFNLLLSTKTYCKQTSQYYSEDEEKRIFTNTIIRPSDILKRCHPEKYRSENQVNTDLGNIVKKMYDLDEANIFYIWRCGFPHVYMFIMERDVGLWKAYNSSACVIPKTLLKIVQSSKNMISTMTSLLQSQKQTPNDIKNSYGQFVNKMIDKMNVSVQQQLTKFKDGENLEEYILNLSLTLKKINPYEGLVEDENFINKLPPNISEILSKNVKKKDFKNLESELSQKNDNIVNTPKIPKVSKPTNKTSINNESILQEEEDFEVKNPFNNCLDFMRFYRSIVKSSNSISKFYPYESERHVAMIILDELVENGRNNDVFFLKSWIIYYVNNNLKGLHEASNIPERTSLKYFSNTFKEYNSKYIGETCNA